ncbi:MAG: hypothetical protein A3F80_01275 [Candidatus Melainabacteria bacterium RIFCSPLOWO2_12_FULL_35_11]|nr:MAG: hypothetical protein A3F80_01275 [Candidatus Melainabacteria bacterium RIFCSPLOWO2_12_FULL_35_11]
MANYIFYSTSVGKIAVGFLAERTNEFKYVVPEKRTASLLVASESWLTDKERRLYIKTIIAPIDNLPRETYRALPVKPDRVYITSIVVDETRKPIRVDESAPDTLYLFLTQVKPKKDAGLVWNEALEEKVLPTTLQDFYCQEVKEGTEYSINIDEYLAKHAPKEVGEVVPVRMAGKKKQTKVVA